MNEEQLKRLEVIVEQVKSGVTKKEFEDAFAAALKLIVKREEMISKAVSMLEQTFNNALVRVQGDHATLHGDLRKQVDSVFVGDAVKKMDAESKATLKEVCGKMMDMCDKKIREMDKKMSSVKDGERGPMGPIGPMGKQGVAADVEEMKKLREEVDSLKKRPVGRVGGGRKVPMISVQDLTSQVNGSATTFTLPKDTVKVHAVWSTQFPTILSSSDFSLSGNTLSLGSGVGTLQSGQTLMVMIESLFYLG